MGESGGSSVSRGGKQSKQSKGRGDSRELGKAKRKAEQLQAGRAWKIHFREPKAFGACGVDYQSQGEISEILFEEGWRRDKVAVQKK